ncbi:289_t:CDS:2 [Entrophospora sp. SA101]|nr:13758_t:CDS:2 [Entrophospora sp. SA101]CAJ0831418.1 289_t:CDS:2 [Entrophospora sp. SA101]
MTWKRLKITVVFLLTITITIASFFISYRESIDILVHKNPVTAISIHDNNRDKIINHQETKPFTIVTAASKNHFRAIQCWLYDLKGATNSIKVSKRPRIIVYDIGLLKDQYKWLSILLDKGYMTELRRFDFEIYPEFWRIRNHTRGEYGWKPGIISEVVKDYPGPTLWLDSGTYVSPEFLEQFEFTLDYYNGFFSPTSYGNIQKWTHPGVFKYFNDDPNKYANFLNCNGAAVAFDSNKVGSLVNDWVECALVKECIAPEGSSRENHRQDQAILTYLAARHKRFCEIKPRFFGLNTHMDGECKKKLKYYENQNSITSSINW